VRIRLITAGLLTLGVLTACTTPSGTSGTSAPDGTHIVLAVSSEPDTLNPLLGYGAEGTSKIFDGLLAYQADRSLRPALAADLPEPSADGLSWTVRLRQDVKFHDGSTFDAEDVVATYTAALDPAYASTVRSDYAMITKVEQLGPHEVRFDLAYPYSALPHKLTLGILPSEALAEPAPLDRSPINTAPVGTGPYRLGEWRQGDRMVLEANESYFDGVPQVREITVVFAPDDNTRAQRVRAGEIDGAELPPHLAGTFEDLDGYQVISHRSADYRVVALPMNHPVAGDRAVRLALNHAVNRQGMVDAVLAGKGVPAHTIIPGALAEYVEPGAEFRYDPAEAERILDAAGWVKGPDGLRSRNGQTARFTLMYPAHDSVRKDLAQAFASDAKAIGVEVLLEGLGWEAIEPRMGTDAVLLGDGSPFDPDLRAYSMLHSSYAGNGFNNPGGYNNPQVDAALDAARRTTDQAQRVAAYRAMQRAYLEDPGMVFLVFLDHTYVLREGWEGYQSVIEPHNHGVTWGPWWNIEDWTPRR